MTEPKARATRYDIRLSAELRLDGKLVTGVTRNLSVGGVCVELDRPVAEGAVLKLILFVVENDVETEGLRGLEVDGTVQWAAEADRGWAIGVKFAPLNAAQTKAVTNALRAMGDPG
jgi:PilZ domain